MITVNCPRCGVENEISLDRLDSRRDIVCGKCGKTYSFDVLQEVYENEPLVKKSVDTVVRYATRKWTLDGNTRVVDATKKSLERLKFGDLLGNAATQVLVHGDAFLRTTATEWELLPPHRTKIEASWVPDPDGSSIPILKETKFNCNSNVFGPEQIIHFKKLQLGWTNTPYGDSMIRIVVPYVYKLRDFRKVPIGIQSENSWWGEHLEQTIRTGLLAIPDFVLNRRSPSYDRRVAELQLVLLIGEVNDLQEVLAKGFNEALRRLSKHLGFPDQSKIQFKKLTSRGVLMDCGFNFSDEGDRKAMIRKLRDIGIINQEACDRMLREYDEDQNVW